MRWYQHEAPLPSPEEPHGYPRYNHRGPSCCKGARSFGTSAMKISCFIRLLPAHCRRRSGYCGLFRRRSGRRGCDSPAALVGTAGMGRGSGGQGISNSVPVWNRNHRLHGPAAGGHPGPAAGTQWASDIGQEFPADQSGRHFPAERLGEVRRPRLPVPGRLCPRWIHDREPRTDSSWCPPTPAWASSSPESCSSMPRSMARPYGAGVTLQGGGKVSDWHDLTAIVVADWNRTQTKLSFENETLVANTKPIATVFSARVGLHGTVGPLERRGGLDRCDASAHPGGRSRAALPIRTFNSSCSSRRRNPGTRCSVACSSSARTAMSSSKEVSALASRSSHQPCTGSDRLIFRPRQREDSVDHRDSCGSFP